MNCHSPTCRSGANSFLEEGQVMNVLTNDTGERSEEKVDILGLDLHYNTAAEVRNRNYKKTWSSYYTLL